MISSTKNFAAIDQFRDSNGLFSMVAVDQRGSLRNMLAQNSAGQSVPDSDLVQFKADVATYLTPGASGLLIDSEFGLAAAQAAQCPVILAADLLWASVTGGPVDSAALDEELSAKQAHQFGAKALKMLVPWTEDTRSEAVDLSHRFMELAWSMNLPGIVEGVVRPPDFSTWPIAKRNDALVAAAADLATTHPDLYKAEVVYSTPDHHEPAVEAAKGITEVMPVPWVILSSGIPAELFANALAAAVTGGAQGFLAGRALWADACASPDRAAFLKGESCDRLNKLAQVVSENVPATQT